MQHFKTLRGLKAHQTRGKDKGCKPKTAAPADTKEFDVISPHPKGKNYTRLVYYYFFIFKAFFQRSGSLISFLQFYYIILLQRNQGDSHSFGFKPASQSV